MEDFPTPRVPQSIEARRRKIGSAYCSTKAAFAPAIEIGGMFIGLLSIDRPSVSAGPDVLWWSLRLMCWRLMCRWGLPPCRCPQASGKRRNFDWRPVTHTERANHQERRHHGGQQTHDRILWDFHVGEPQYSGNQRKK